MAGELKRRPADAALLFGALFAALLPSIFLAGPVAWWVWERDWPGIGWLSRIIAVAAALLIPALMVGAAWFGVRWYAHRGVEPAQGTAEDVPAEKPADEVKTAAVSSAASASSVSAAASASSAGETEAFDRLEMEPSVP